MKKKILILLFIIYIFGFGIISLFNTETISFSERRKLQALPSILTSTNKFNDKFFDELDKYLSDHFVLRDEFRMLKATFVKDVFMMDDNNSIFTEDGYIFEMEEKINEDSVTYFTNLTSSIIDKYFNDQDVKFVIIPRKNDYLLNNNHPDYKYEDMLTLLDNQLDYEIVDIYDLLSLDSYYQTDIHWRTEKIIDVAKTITEAFNDTYQDTTYVENKFSPFYGALYAKAASNLAADELIYLTSDTFDSVNIYSLEANGNVAMYDLDELTSLDSYSVFVDGPSAYLEITNENALNDETLIIFRDSFTSSLLPHLVNTYSKIQVVDIRYINSSLLEQISFDSNAKVLFIYGLEVINNSYSLK